MYPTGGTLRRRFGDGLGNVDASIPVLRFSVNMTAQFQHVGMSAEFGGDFLQFFVCLKMVAQFQPALSRHQVVAVRRFKWSHENVSLSAPPLLPPSGIACLDQAISNPQPPPV